MDFTRDEFFEAEYKLQNCIRVTLNVEFYTVEVNTGKRWVKVSEYVEALIRYSRLDELNGAAKNGMYATYFQNRLDKLA